MSSVSSVLGAIAVLSIMLVATAGTEGDITNLLGMNVTSSTTTTTMGSIVVESSTDHWSNGTELRIDEAVSTTGTETTTTTRNERRNTIPNGSYTTRDTEITVATVIPTEATAANPISSKTYGVMSVKAKATTTATTITTTTISLPRQERLVALVQNVTDYYTHENLARTISSLSRENDEMTSPEIHMLTRSPLDTTNVGSSVETTTTTTATSTTTMMGTTGTTTVKSTVPTGSVLLGKSVLSKSRNDLVGGNFHEIKSAQKVNNANRGYVGGKVPNVPSVLGKYTPYFEDGQEELNVTARIGNTVILDCEIGMLGNKTVTWSYHSSDVIRLLTVGRNAYSVDQRISLYFRYPTNWRLRIQYATPRDSGLYECQVATYPPLVKKIHLLVTAPILIIMDDSGRIKSGERHLKAGSALRLRCEARDIPERYNETVIWSRGDEILSEDVSENRTTEYVDGREIQVIVSTLLIEKATPRHAGNYSCLVPEKAKTTVAVHVLNGELPAAVHDGNGVSRSVLNLWLIHLTVSYVFSR